MREYFTIMVKENDTTNLKLLTEKLNAGFYIDDRITVGRSTLLTLQKRTEESSRLRRQYQDVETSAMYQISESPTQG